jgi:hypothetical protein
MAGTREKLARLKGFAGLVSCMQLFEKAQYWAAVEARMRMAETLREQLEVCGSCLLSLGCKRLADVCSFV